MTWWGCDGVVLHMLYVKADMHYLLTMFLHFSVHVYSFIKYFVCGLLEKL